MKCPHCGNDSRTKGVCSSCGDKMEMPEQTIEIEYKEFKVSEFMEIRRRRKGPGRKRDEGALTKGSGDEEEDYRTGENIRIAAGFASLLRGGKRNRFLIIVLVIIALAVITGAYYLLKFLHHQWV